MTHLRTSTLMMNQAKKLSDVELLETFPEAKRIIRQKLKEYRQQREVIVARIKDKLTVINTEPDEFSRWFWRKWLMLNEGKELMEVDQHLARLNRELRLIKGFKAKPGQLNDDLVQAARDVTIESLVGQPRRSGRDLVALCPLHDEKTPSFHIYREQNRGWCFGCNRGGDSIHLTMLIHNLGFKEAVLLLTGGQS